MSVSCPARPTVDARCYGTVTTMQYLWADVGMSVLISIWFIVLTVVLWVRTAKHLAVSKEVEVLLIDLRSLKNHLKVTVERLEVLALHLNKRS